jgi:DNA invertase Pin-like site-specific DNA recombinase
MNSKITPEHLARRAYVYVRQSSQDQVRNHQESRRRQYALQEHAQALGWRDVAVIDEDQGRSGGGTTVRSGFERLLTEVCEVKVGAVLALEISRLARNGREWHTLMEFCAVVGTLLVDEHGVYDPGLTNDRLLLGMKSTMAEMELSTLRQRSHEARKLKASRGEYYTSVAIGYVRNESGGLDKDPDDRVREAIELIFRKFTELGSVRKVLIWHHQEALCVPYVQYGARVHQLEWKPPTYQWLLHLLQKPIYAGAYVYGRRTGRVTLRDGRKRIVYTRVRDPNQWAVLIRDHHEDYISWDTFDHNQHMITHNANMLGERVQGSIRRGEALLAGLLRCGHCGRKLAVMYGGGRGGVGRYLCRDPKTSRTRTCISFGALRVDAAVCEEVLRRLQPLGIEAALKAIEAQERTGDDVHRHVELALEQARYEASSARRQYDSVDPLNRLVAAELERRWNERLLRVAELENKLADSKRASHQQLSQDEHQALLALGSDLQKVWNHPGASVETRKRILRTVIKEIMVRVEGTQVQLKLHWQGGDHTELIARKNPSGTSHFATDPDTVDLMRSLARLLPDASIAALLNRMGKRTSKGNTWNAVRVCALRSSHDIAVYRDGERAERGEVNLEEAAQLLQVKSMTVLRLIQRKVLAARQPCAGAPWSIQRGALHSPAVRQALIVGRYKGPLTPDPGQASIHFQ